MKRLLSGACLVLAFILNACDDGSQALAELYGRFREPSDEARPLVWWHWMNGNITREGLRKDIEWMHRSGIAGFHVFDAGLKTPCIVDERLDYMTPPWRDAFAQALRLADSLGMEATVASSPGWSSTGGPWVEKEDAMKKIVWRTCDVEGGSLFHGPLPAPFGTFGYIQDIPLDGPVPSHGDVAPADSFYRDLFVLAARLPEKERPMMEGAKVLSSGGPLDAARLEEDAWMPAEVIRPDASGRCWVRIEFPEERTVKGISYFVGKETRARGHAYEMRCDDTLRVSGDGVRWETVCGLPLGSSVTQTLAFAPVTGRFFRVDYRPQQRSAHQQPRIGRLVLHGASCVHRVEEKAGYAACHDLEDTPYDPDEDVLGEVIDLTDRFHDGTLDWTVPEGRWRIWRFGWSLTGKRNHPASPEATGLEVDKLDPGAWTRYFTHYLDMYRDASGGLMGRRGLQYVLTDSYEANAQNWTPALRNEFRTRRGYDPLPWFPVLTGALVGSSAQSDDFLRDWRRTLGELFAENYALLTDIVRERYGMKGCYIESHENGRVFVSDGMDIKKTASFPMSAHWVQEPSRLGRCSRAIEGESDIRESASVAHLYGSNRVAAESLTANGEHRLAYSFCPENLKPVADHMLASGLNRFVIHESAHQPSDSLAPGLSLGKYGQWFNRHETWAEEARPWMDYLARSCQMLMEGRFCADILVCYGEDSNVTGQYSHSLPPIPPGYAFDYLSPSALDECLSVRSGRFVTPSGMSYRMLYLNENCRRMSVEYLRKIAELVRGGAVICGTVPSAPGGLNEDREEFDRLVGEIWHSGRNHVYGGVSLAEALDSAGIAPDLEFSGEPLPFVHRSLEGIDIYWLCNPSDEPRTVEASFEVHGRIPECWRPEDASVEALSWHRERGRTAVTLPMLPHDAFFVVFGRKAGRLKEGHVPPRRERLLARLAGDWELVFPEGRGVDGLRLRSRLGSLTDRPEPGVRYFSGTVSYEKRFVVPALREGERVVLDLGRVCNLARVFLNGKDLGQRWHAPFTVDLTDALCEGENRLNVQVTNLWPNRLIGDAQPGAVPMTYTAYPYYKADDPLLPSGLLGPVRLVCVNTHE